MRILYFTTDYTTHDRRFLAKMAECADDVFLLRLRDDGVSPTALELPDRVTELRWHGAPKELRSEESSQAVVRLREVIQTLQPNVIHAGPIPTCAHLAAMAGATPLVSMSWGSDILVDAQQAAARTGARFAIERSAAVVVDCDAVRDAVSSIAPGARPRFVQFPWGLELSRFPRVEPRPTPSGEFIVLSTRSWAPIYDIDTVIESFALAHREQPRLRMRLVGDGPLREHLADLIARLELNDAIVCPGRVPEAKLTDHFANADAYLSCSKSDGTSISMLEAMAFGLPVVVTDIPGNREWVTPGKAGWLARPGDIHSFAEGLLRASSLDDSTRAEIASHNRATIEERADWDKNAVALTHLYRDLAT